MSFYIFVHIFHKKTKKRFPTNVHELYILPDILEFLFKQIAILFHTSQDAYNE